MHPGKGTSVDQSQPTRKKSTLGARIFKGFITFWIVWMFLSFAAHVYVPLDSTGNPELDPEVDETTERLAPVVGILTGILAAMCGLRVFLSGRDRTG